MSKPYEGKLNFATMGKYEGYDLSSSEMAGFLKLAYGGATQLDSNAAIQLMKNITDGVKDISVPANDFIPPIQKQLENQLQTLNIDPKYYDFYINNYFLPYLTDAPHTQATVDDKLGRSSDNLDALRRAMNVITGSKTSKPVQLTDGNRRTLQNVISQNMVKIMYMATAKHIIHPHNRNPQERTETKSAGQLVASIINHQFTDNSKYINDESLQPAGDPLSTDPAPVRDAKYYSGNLVFASISNDLLTAMKEEETGGLLEYVKRKYSKDAQDRTGPQWEALRNDSMRGRRKLLNIPANEFIQPIQKQLETQLQTLNINPDYNQFYIENYFLPYLTELPPEYDTDAKLRYSSDNLDALRRSLSIMRNQASSSKTAGELSNDDAQMLQQTIQDNMQHIVDMQALVAGDKTPIGLALANQIEYRWNNKSNANSNLLYIQSEGGDAGNPLPTDPQPTKNPSSTPPSTPSTPPSTPSTPPSTPSTPPSTPSTPPAQKPYNPYIDPQIQQKQNAAISGDKQRITEGLFVDGEYQGMQNAGYGIYYGKRVPELAALFKQYVHVLRPMFDIAQNTDKTKEYRISPDIDISPENAEYGKNRTEAEQFIDDFSKLFKYKDFDVHDNPNGAITAGDGERSRDAISALAASLAINQYEHPDNPTFTPESLSQQARDTLQIYDYVPGTDMSRQLVGVDTTNEKTLTYMLPPIAGVPARAVSVDKNELMTGLQDNLLSLVNTYNIDPSMISTFIRDMVLPSMGVGQIGQLTNLTPNPNPTQPLSALSDKDKNLLSQAVESNLQVIMNNMGASGSPTKTITENLIDHLNTSFDSNFPLTPGSGGGGGDKPDPSGGGGGGNKPNPHPNRRRNPFRFLTPVEEEEDVLNTESYNQLVGADIVAQKQLAQGFANVYKRNISDVDREVRVPNMDADSNELYLNRDKFDHVLQTYKRDIQHSGQTHIQSAQQYYMQNGRDPLFHQWLKERHEGTHGATFHQYKDNHQRQYTIEEYDTAELQGVDHTIHTLAQQRPRNEYGFAAGYRAHETMTESISSTLALPIGLFVAGHVSRVLHSHRKESTTFNDAMNVYIADEIHKIDYRDPVAPAELLLKAGITIIGYHVMRVPDINKVLDDYVTHQDNIGIMDANMRDYIYGRLVNLTMLLQQTRHDDILSLIDTFNEFVMDVENLLPSQASLSDCFNEDTLHKIDVFTPFPLTPILRRTRNVVQALVKCYDKFERAEIERQLATIQVMFGDMNMSTAAILDASVANKELHGHRKLQTVQMANPITSFITLISQIPDARIVM